MSAYGLLWIAAAFTASRANIPVSQAIFWVGMILLLLPAAIRVIKPNVGRSERLAILMITGVALYMVKVLYSPILFTYLDELQHWRTVQNILISHHLYGFNPILTVSAVYPGLEIVTDALISLTGLTIFQAGLIVIGVGRLVAVLALFLLFERISTSSQVAGIGTLLYMANPHFLLFDAQFAYESLALPLAVLTLYCAMRYARLRGKGKLGFGLSAFGGMAAVIVTHHITSFVLASIFLLWTFILLIKIRPILNRLVPTWIGIFGLIGIMAWITFVATQAITYLSSPLTSAINDLIGLILGTRSARHLFVQTGVNQPDFLLLRFLAISAVVLILAGLPFGALKVWQKYRNNNLALVLTAIGLIYPVTLVVRYLPWGLIISSRTAPYIFLGIGFVLAVIYPNLRIPERNEWKYRSAFTAAVMLIFLGMIASGVAAWGLPVTYQQNSYTNSADLQGEFASQWVLNTFGPYRRVAAEQDLLWEMGAYGLQRSITPDTDRIWFDNFYSTPGLGPDKLQLLKSSKIQFLSIDQRNNSPLLLPKQAGTTSTGPVQAVPASQYISALSNIDQIRGISRIYDSGDIVTYDVGALTGEK
ncbi:MAG: hypothetical protein ACM3PY_16235 [Omnitrophica WOR_2 bacterium]